MSEQEIESLAAICRVKPVMGRLSSCREFEIIAVRDVKPLRGKYSFNIETFMMIYEDWGNI